VVFPTSDLSPDSFCSNGYALSSEVQAPFISPSGKCYHRASESEDDCSAAYADRSRICLCSSPFLAGYYGTSSQCRRCPRGSTSAAGKSFVTSCICEDGFYLVTDETKPYGYVLCAIMIHIGTLIQTFSYHTYILLTNSTHIRTLTHTYSTRPCTQGLGILSAMSNVYAIPSGQHQHIRLQVQGSLISRKWSV
jgi:hypothetical protein